jgi:hypothetical protein
MSFTPVRKVFVNIGGPEGPAITRALVSMQDSAAEALRSVQQPIVDGVLLRDVVLSNFSADINHGLGRRWNGYVVTRSSNGLWVFDGTGSPDPKTAISLLSTNDTVVDLWVF